MPRVSVLMPIYKPAVAYLRQALDRLFAQTETDWECILMNQPGSDVRTSIASYLEDPRVRFFQSEQPRTIGENWNACLPYATSPYVAYLFYDDLWEPAYLATLADILDAHPAVGFVSANHTYLFQGDIPEHPIYDEVTAFTETHVAPGMHEGIPLLLWWMEQGLRPNFIGEPSFVMLRRSLMHTIGPWHETMTQFLDSEYWTRCLAKSTWYREQTMLGAFRVHAAATTAQNATAGKGLTDRLITFDAAIDLLPSKHRPRAKKALKQALSTMMVRFVQRKKEGSINGVEEGKRGLLTFCLRHPVMVLGAVLSARSHAVTAS